MSLESMQSMVYRLREDENAMSTGENQEIQDLIDKLVGAIMSGQITIDQAHEMIDSPIETDIEEMSVSGGGMAYNPGLDVPKKKYAAPYAENQKDLNEGYLSFKKETMLRNKSQQFHEGVKIVRKNLNNIQKMMEYLSRLKEELNCDNEIKETKSTIKEIDQITNHIKEIYLNYKKIK